MPTQIKNKNVRKEAVSQETLQGLKDSSYTLWNKAKVVYEGRVKPTKIVDQWYKPKKVAQNDSQTSQIQIGDAVKTWKELATQLENLHVQGDMKAFFTLVKKATYIKPRQPIVAGVELENGQVLLDRNQVNKAIAQHFREADAGYGIPDIPMKGKDAMQDQFSQPFRESELEDALRQCNFSKAIGTDGLDCRILLKDKELKDKILKELAQMMNQRQFPQYFQEGLLVPISKLKRGTAGPRQQPTEHPGDSAHNTQSEPPAKLPIFPKLTEIRPIIVKQQITKILEKALLARIQQNHSHLISVGRYQTGFQKGLSPVVNLAQVVFQITSSMRIPNSRKHTMMIDLESAYNTVNRGKLIETLLSRCKNSDDRIIVEIIERLYEKQIIVVGEEYFETRNGLPQGSVLSPILFNVMLDEAIKSLPCTSQVARRGDLKAFADDILIQSSSLSELSMVLKELAGLSVEWGLRLNLGKCEWLPFRGFEDSEGTLGISKVDKVKYLGMVISTDPAEIESNAKLSIKRNIYAYKGKLSRCSQMVKEQLIVSFARSLLIYFGTPLVLAKLWTLEDIDKIEKQIYRESFLLPRDIAGDVVVNTIRQAEPTKDVIARLVERNEKIYSQQTKLPFLSRHKETSPKEKGEQPKLYIPRYLSDMILSFTRGRTLINFGAAHVCKTHDTVVDKAHLEQCEVIAAKQDIWKYIPMIRKGRLQCWDENEIIQCSLLFSHLHMRLLSLESEGLITKQMQNWKKEKNQVSNKLSPAPRGRPRKPNLQHGQTRIDQYVIAKNRD